MFWYTECLICKKEFDSKQRKGFCSDECFNIGQQNRINRMRVKARERRLADKAKHTDRLPMKIDSVKNFDYIPIVSLNLNETAKMGLKAMLRQNNLGKVIKYKFRRVDGQKKTYNVIAASGIEMQILVARQYNKYLDTNNLKYYNSAKLYNKIYKMVNEAM